MPVAKKHRFLVEVTDMYAGYTSAEMRNHLFNVIDYGSHNLARDFENIQVKQYNRYEQGIANAERKKAGITDWNKLFEEAGITFEEGKALMQFLKSIKKKTGGQNGNNE